MRVYMGYRIGGLCYAYHWDATAPAQPVKLNPRIDLRSHSPHFLEWGYGGSGPAQLALALCADALADSGRALTIYQEFKLHVVARLPRDCWSMTRDQVCDHITRLEGLRPAKEGVGNGNA